MTGSDSVVDTPTRGFFNFLGIPKSEYYRLADNTARTLTGDSLGSFGITESSAVDLIASSDTIAQFYGQVNEAADTVRGRVWSVLKQRVIPHLWVVLPGDDVAAIQATAGELTQGTRSRVDVDMVGEFIDAPSNKAIYVDDWRKRRSDLANLLRSVDARLFPLSPNVALAAVRTFGDDVLKTQLNSKTMGLEAGKTTMRATRLYKAILTQAGKPTLPFAGYRPVSRETEDEFLRVQRGAARNDKPLNKALGSLIGACLAEDAPELVVINEKRTLPGSQLQPDIQIQLSDQEYIFLEPTWRTTGRGIANEIITSQSTLTSAHMKKYVLEKSMQYVKDFKL